jgi:cytochrome c peroxidase
MADSWGMWRFVIAAALLSGVVGCGDAEGVPFLGPSPPPSPPSIAREDLNPRMLRRFRPVHPDTENADQVALGKMLYFDPRLSRKENTSCNTCHALDRHATPISNHGTVFNAAAHIARFWDAADLEPQGDASIVDQMEIVEPQAVSVALQHIPGYVAAFGRAFPDEPIDLVHVARAIAAFERTLVTPSRWDQFLEGDHRAMSHHEQEGLKVFAEVGCVQCHTGELVGASMFQKAGIVDAWPNQTDQGRYEITQADRLLFEVPSLRTPVVSLRVALMGKHPLGVELSPEEVASIETWLKVLDGTPPLVAPPTRP